MAQLPNDTTSERILAFDILKAAAIIGVVYLHSSEPVVNGLQIVTHQTSWTIVTFLNTSWSWSVPVLFMISGALALDPNRSSRQNYVRTRLLRLSSALIVGLLLQALVTWLTMGTGTSFQQLAYSLIFDQPYGYLYFLCALLLLTPLAPWIGRYLAQLSRRQSQVVTLAGLVLTVATFGLSRFVVLLIPTYLGFFIAGRTLLQVKLKRTSQLLISGLAMCAIAGLLLFFLYQEKIHGLTSALLQQYVTYRHNASPAVIVLSILAYVVMLSPMVSSWVKKRSKLSRGVSLIAKYSLGIYLLHVPMMQLMRHWLPQTQELYASQPLLTTVAIAMVITSLALGASMLVSQFKIGKQVVT